MTSQSLCTYLCLTSTVCKSLWKIKGCCVQFDWACFLSFSHCIIIMFFIVQHLCTSLYVLTLRSSVGEASNGPMTMICMSCRLVQQQVPCLCISHLKVPQWRKNCFRTDLTSTHETKSIFSAYSVVTVIIRVMVTLCKMSNFDITMSSN